MKIAVCSIIHSASSLDCRKPTGSSKNCLTYGLIQNRERLFCISPWITFYSPWHWAAH